MGYSSMTNLVTGDLVTEAEWDKILANFEYFKGQAGTVTIEDIVNVTRTYAGISGHYRASNLTAAAAGIGSAFVHAGAAGETLAYTAGAHEDGTGFNAYMEWVSLASNVLTSHMRLTSLGKLGLGTSGTGIDERLHVEAEGAVAIQVENRAAGTTGDPTVKWAINGTVKATLGVDDSDSDKLKLSASSALGTTDVFSVTSGSADLTMLGHLVLDTNADIVCGSSSIIRSTGDVWIVCDSDNDSSSCAIEFGHNAADGTHTVLARIQENGSVNVYGHLLLQEQSSTPSVPADGIQCNVYMKGDKFIIQYNDGGTARYKYLDLTGTGVTWVHDTVAP